MMRDKILEENKNITGVDYSNELNDLYMRIPYLIKIINDNQCKKTDRDNIVAILNIIYPY